MLIVEDNDALRLTCKDVIEFEGYLVKEARDGREALDMVFSNGFYAILMDVMMPRVDGITACKEIKNHLFGVCLRAFRLIHLVRG